MRTGKRGFVFSWIRNSKIIDCEHVIVQRVVLLFFPVKFYQTIPNKRNYDYTNYVRNIFQETIVQGIYRQKSLKRARGYFGLKFCLCTCPLVFPEVNNLT